MNKVAAFALRRKNSILSMSEKVFCPPQPLRFWITPAYAGKSLPEFDGYNFERGKVVGSEELPGVVGITPTYAGKSPPESDFAEHRWDYPRVCGEKNNLRQAFAIQQGSPPAYAGKR